ncbi:MAG: 1-aminocyclopropane-1-carboxylate deaminase/D-cysteine desulfhydrase [Myxococcota bacterium]
MPNRPIFDRYPPARDLPHIELADLPTPVEKLSEAARHVDIPSLWVKRDDVTGKIYGGNKVRKLEFLLGDAKDKGHDQVWTVGAIGSNHALATCLYAREVDLAPAVLHYPQPVTDHVLHNLKAISSANPDLTLASNFASVSYEMAKRKVKEWLATGDNPYYVPAGGSSPVGVLGYVNAALELAEQIAAGECPEPDYIFVAAGTCGTLSGLLLGVKMAALDTRVLGVRVVDKVITNAPNTRRLANGAADLLEECGVQNVPRIDKNDVTILSDYFGEGYGEATVDGREAIHTLSELEDLYLEPTYTGKAFAGLLGERENLELHSKNVMYWHTLSSADLSERIASVDVARDLPSEYQQFFK